MTMVYNSAADETESTSDLSLTVEVDTAAIFSLRRHRSSKSELRIEKCINQFT